MLVVLVMSGDGMYAAIKYIFIIIDSLTNKLFNHSFKHLFFFGYYRLTKFKIIMKIIIYYCLQHKFVTTYCYWRIKMIAFWKLFKNLNI